MTILTHRLAQLSDQPAIITLMQASIEVNMREFLSEEEIHAAKETMGIDTSLIEDQTYFLIETVHKGEQVPYCLISAKTQPEKPGLNL